MYMAKQRTQLYLDKHQKDILEEYSRATGRSLGQLVREAVDEVYLNRRPLERVIPRADPLWHYIGAAESGEKDISDRHDEYLYTADS